MKSHGPSIRMFFCACLLLGCGSQPRDLVRDAGRAPLNDAGSPMPNAPGDAAVRADSSGPDTSMDAAPLPASGRRIGDPCSTNTNCESRFCFTPEDGYPEGYCSFAGCSRDSSCDADSVCLQRAAGLRFCALECDGPADCRKGYECVEYNTDTACVPALVAEALEPRCESTLLDFNATGVAFSSGFRSLNRHQVDFTIPAGTGSFLVMAWDRNGLVFPERLVAPNGRTLEMSDYAPLLFTAANFENIAPVLIPATPDYREWVMEGRYSMTYGWSGQANQKLCHVVIPEPASELQAGVQQVLDLTVYFAGARSLDETTAPTNALFETVLDRVDEAFAQGDVRLGDVRYRGLSNEVADAFSVVRSSSEVRELCSFTALPDGDADDQLRLNVVVVDGFAGSLSGVLGISAGIMGGVGAHGSNASCVVFGAAGLDSLGSARAIGKTMAHEIGHFLGLFHTTELDGRTTDPLSDTPFCIDSRGLPRARSCSDFDNLMFPYAYADSLGLLSNQQGEVIRANPLTRAE